MTRNGTPLTSDSRTVSRTSRLTFVGASDLMTSRMCPAAPGVKRSPCLAEARAARIASCNAALCFSISSGLASFESFGSFPSMPSRKETYSLTRASKAAKASLCFGDTWTCAAGPVVCAEADGVAGCAANKSATARHAQAAPPINLLAFIN